MKSIDQFSDFLFPTMIRSLGFVSGSTITVALRQTPAGRSLQHEALILGKTLSQQKGDPTVQRDEGWALPVLGRCVRSAQEHKNIIKKTKRWFKKYLIKISYPAPLL
jgi:hypothetical protein